MLQNKLIVTKRSDKEKIYENSKDKWIIELEGDKIKDWNDFYDIMQKEIDILDYNSKFGRGGHTYDDFATDIELFNEVKKRNAKGMVMILNYTKKFKEVSEGEKGYIYYDTIFTLLLEWYRDLRIVYKQEKPTIDIEMYILIDDNLFKKRPDFKNELIIGIEEDKEEIGNKFKDYKLIKLSASLGMESKIFLEKLEKEVKKIINKRIKILLLNPENLCFVYERSILIDIVENILIRKYEEGKEVKIYLIFKNDIF